MRNYKITKNTEKQVGIPKNNDALVCIHLRKRVYKITVNKNTVGFSLNQKFYFSIYLNAINNEW